MLLFSYCLLIYLAFGPDSEGNYTPRGNWGLTPLGFPRGKGGLWSEEGQVSLGTSRPSAFPCDILSAQGGQLGWLGGKGSRKRAVRGILLNQSQDSQNRQIDVPFFSFSSVWQFHIKSVAVFIIAIFLFASGFNPPCAILDLQVEVTAG